LIENKYYDNTDKLHPQGYNYFNIVCILDQKIDITKEMATSTCKRPLTADITVGGIRSAKWSWPLDESPSEASLTHVRDIEHFYSCSAIQHKETGMNLHW
jgi:hypothetical protein